MAFIKVAKVVKFKSLGILGNSACEISRGYEFSCSIMLSKLHDFKKTEMTNFDKKWLFDFTFICSADKSSFS